MTADPHSIASKWLVQCAAALSEADIDALVQLLLPDSWLRDFLVFTWDIRSLNGRDKIAAYLANTLGSARIVDVKLDEDQHLAPRLVPLPQMQNTPAVELAFTFECKHGHGHAHARLLEDVDGVYRAVTLFVEVSDLVGHEELSTLPLRDDVTGIPGRDMQKEMQDYVRQIETNPFVLIGMSPCCLFSPPLLMRDTVGAGQAGLIVAARFKQMNIPTLVIERHPRVGDSWRKRYPTLTLHTVKGHHTRRHCVHAYRCWGLSSSFSIISALPRQLARIYTTRQARRMDGDVCLHARSGSLDKFRVEGTPRLLS